jgi:hypothetical protein
MVAEVTTKFQMHNAVVDWKPRGHIKVFLGRNA